MCHDPHTLSFTSSPCVSPEKREPWHTLAFSFWHFLQDRSQHTHPWPVSYSSLGCLCVRCDPHRRHTKAPLEPRAATDGCHSLAAVWSEGLDPHQPNNEVVLDTHHHAHRHLNAWALISTSNLPESTLACCSASAIHEKHSLGKRP